MKSKLFLIFIMLFGLLLVTPKQNKANADMEQLNLGALEVADYVTIVPQDVISMQAATLQKGFMDWLSMITNYSQTPVTNATASVTSGYDPSFFRWPVASFPFTESVDSIAGGGSQIMGKLLHESSTFPPVYYSLGYDSTKTVSPIMIPVGGTQQTVTITVTPVDSRYASEGDSFVVTIKSNISGVTVVSTTDPTNLDQGQQVNDVVPGDDPNYGLFQWHLDSFFPFQLNKQYTFTAVLNVPNQSGAPVEFLPEVRIDGIVSTLVCEACAGPTTVVPDATLDGPVPGIGAVTFSVAETNYTWSSQHSDTYGIIYDGTSPPKYNLPKSKDQCKKGGWQKFTNPSFKNQGDCVSYVATHGKNPPDGN
jgi:hypothetical protein